MPLEYNNDDGAQALDQQQELDFRRGWQVVDAAAGSNVVTAGTGAYEVDVAAGDINTPTGTVACSSATLDLQSFVDTDLPRIVLVYRDGSGTAQTLVGAPAEKQPAGEATPAGLYQPAPDAFSGTDGVVLATVLLEAAAASVGSGQIRDRRMPASLNVDSATVGSLSTDEGRITNETFIRATRGIESASTSAGTFINIFDGESKDNRGEFDSAAEFTPDKDGEYEYFIVLDIRGGTTAGDELGFRLLESDDTFVEVLGKAVATGGNVENPVSGVIELSSTKTYKFTITNNNNSFIVDPGDTRGVIRRSVIQ